jgi:hypothetical protein
MEGGLRVTTSTVTFVPHLAALMCCGCGETTPLSRATMRNQERIVEELAMAREVHEGCKGKTPAAARREREWRKGFLTDLHQRTDRLAWSG